MQKPENHPKEEMRALLASSRAWLPLLSCATNVPNVTSFVGEATNEES